MRNRLSQWLTVLSTGFWFVPMLMLALSCGLALFLLYVDQKMDPGVRATIAWAYSGGPEGARSLLSTIAGSMITAASVTFSLASVSIILFVASLVLLIYFIHHISSSIQASHILRVIGEDVEQAIPRLYLSETGEPFDETGSSEQLALRGGVPLSLQRSGYLQSLDLDKLLAIAVDENLVIELVVKPGDHILKGEPIAWIGGSVQPSAETLDKATDAFRIGGERTPEQDIRFQFQQLTDVVLRALSPGLKLLTPGLDEILEETVGHIAIYASEDRFVMAGLRRVLEAVGTKLRTEKERSAWMRLRSDLDQRQMEGSA